MIMVDEVRRLPGARAHFRAGLCHATTDGAPAELHAFAAEMGLPRSRFHGDGPGPRYDLTPAEQAAAIGAGAVFVPAEDQARARRSAAIHAQNVESEDMIGAFCALLRELGVRPYINTACLDDEQRVRAFRLRACAWLLGGRVAARHVEFDTPKGVRR